MPRISSKFSELHEKREAALVTYMMAGSMPDMQTLDVVRGMIDGGADIIELGFPFSDPLADGPAIQEAAGAALGRGLDMAGFLSMIRRIRKETDIPLILMTYANIFYRHKYDRLVRDAVSAGIDGFVIPDLPPEEAGEYLRVAKKEGAETVFLASPNTPYQRMRKIASVSSGFVYMVAVYGTTGGRGGIPQYAPGALKRAKKAAGGTPVGVGFGISSPADVRGYVDAGADAVIVGSAFLRLAARTPDNILRKRIAAFAKSLKGKTRRHK